jgi:N-methylhydantoinase B
VAEVDPITREVIQHALASAADEMALALYRTARSTVVRDCLDYATSLCDADGEMIAQGVTIPLHLGSVPFAMATLFRKYRGRMEPGDVFILNDPFDGGMHTPDIFIVKPVFWEGLLTAFAVTSAHHLDVGGRLPGSSACDNTDIWQDGLRIPWLKLHRRGDPDESLYALLRANVRVPELMLADVRAQLAACHTGERSVHDLVRRYGRETFVACAAGLIDHTERLVRAEIASWPGRARRSWITSAATAGVGRGCASRSRWRSRGTRSRPTSPAPTRRCPARSTRRCRTPRRSSRCVSARSCARTSRGRRACSAPCG